MTLDTVAAAGSTPEAEQPYAELGLKPDEYARIREILGRRPTSSELAMYSVMWSEHCSYKSSKVHLRQFGEKAPPSDALLVGIGENAGVVDIGDGWAVTFKVESHNHPSYVEPYQGAATGVGGIVRDIISMGARPLAVMDPLRFGAADHPDTRRRGWHRRLRQLPGIAQHRRRGRVRRLLPGKPTGQRAVRRGDEARGHPPGQRPRSGQLGDPVRRPHRRRRYWRRVRARQRDVRRDRSRQTAQCAGRRSVHGEATDRVHAGGARRGAGRGDPGPGRCRHLVCDQRARQQR